jgi:CheY-like chemotaxis protein
MSLSPPAGALRVLVVDDNRDTTDSCCLMLGLYGHRPTAAYDAATALEAARRVRPHVALLDLGLPQVSGLELAARLRAEPGLEGLVLVAITGHSTPQAEKQAAAAGFHHFFRKPICPETLEALLGHYADRLRRAAGPQGSFSL